MLLVGKIRELSGLATIEYHAADSPLWEGELAKYRPFQALAGLNVNECKFIKVSQAKFEKAKRNGKNWKFYQKTRIKIRKLSQHSFTASIEEVNKALNTKYDMKKIQVIPVEQQIISNLLLESTNIKRIVCTGKIWSLYWP